MGIPELKIVPTSKNRHRRHERHQSGRMKVCTIAVALMAIMVLSVMYTSAAPMESEESVPEDLEPIETERRSGNLFARCFDNNGCASGCWCRKLFPNARVGQCTGRCSSGPTLPGGR